MSEALKQLEEYRAEVSAVLSSIAAGPADGVELADAEQRLRDIKDRTVELTGKRSRPTEFRSRMPRLDCERSRTGRLS
jgi:hypothetical protein